MDEFDIFTLNFFLYFMLTGIIIYMLFYMPYTEARIVDSFEISKKESLINLLNGNYK